MGRKMMEELIVRARKIEGLEALNLGVIADDSPAHRLYQALGFRTYGLERRAMVIDGHGIDEELMQLIL